MVFFLLLLKPHFHHDPVDWVKPLCAVWSFLIIYNLTFIASLVTSYPHSHSQLLSLKQKVKCLILTALVNLVKQLKVAYYQKVFHVGSNQQGRNCLGCQSCHKCESKKVPPKQLIWQNIMSFSFFSSHYKNAGVEDFNQFFIPSFWRIICVAVILTTKKISVAVHTDCGYLSLTYHYYPWL